MPCIPYPVWHWQGCECRLLGTGLVMFENASARLHPKCSIPRQKIKKNLLGRGHSPLLRLLPIEEGDTSSPNPTPNLITPNPTPSAPRSSAPTAPRFSRLQHSTFIICPPPISYFWLRACSNPVIPGLAASNSEISGLKKCLIIIAVLKLLDLLFLLYTADLLRLVERHNSASTHVKAKVKAVYSS